jgi:ferredoxin/pyruvate/2-oxoacid:ferredoxin oxidoreductase alpha subunit
MADLLEQASQWVRAHLLGQSGAEAAPTTPMTVRASQVAGVIESRLSELVVTDGQSAGAPSQAVVAQSPSQALEIARGAALGGQRSAAVLGGAAPPTELALTLARATRDRAPFVAHTELRASPDELSGGGHAALATLARSGCLLAVPRDPQRTVDLSVILRRASEMSLTAALVATEPVEPDADASVLVPDAARIRAYLGEGADRVPCPTPAQTLLFGPERRRIPAWMSADRPVAIGTHRQGDELDASLAARAAFFGGHVPEIVRAAIAAFEALTGRAVPMVTKLSASRPQLVLVCLGAAATAAETAARRLEHVEVLGIEWLSPFPAIEVAAAVPPDATVVVLERTGSPGPGSPLFDTVTRALGARSGRTIAAGYGPGRSRPRPEDLVELVRRLHGEPVPAVVHLGLEGIARSSAHPDRQAWLEAVRRAYAPDPGLVAAARPSVPESIEPPRDVPSVVRAHGPGDRSYDALPRLFGEVALPRRTGELSPRVVDPHRALDVLPPAASALSTPRPGPSELPVVDPSACVGCGRCWSACPDGALVASALPLDTWLTSALDRAFPTPERRAAPPVAKARRSLKTVAALVQRSLTQSRARSVGRDTLVEAAEAYLAQSKTDGEEQMALRRVLRTVSDAATELTPAVTEPLFHGPSGSARSPALLLFAVDEPACQGCGICAERCPEAAITMAATSPQIRTRLGREHAIWSDMPGTPPAVLSDIESDSSGAVVGTALLDRHDAEAMLSVPSSEPGSGAQLALRWVAAVSAARRRQEADVRHRTGREAVQKLRAALDAQLAGALRAGDLESFEEAARAAGRHPGNLADVVSSLRARGQHDGLDAALAAERAHTLRELEAWLSRETRSEPPGGMVLGASSIATWLSGDLSNPFRAPTLATAADSALDVAEGLRLGWRQRANAEQRLLDQARLVTVAPADWSEHLASPDAPERGMTEPLLVAVVDGELLGGRALAALGRVLAGTGRLAIVMLDDRPLTTAGPSPLPLAMGVASAFVASTSIAYPDHLATSLRAAFAHPGPSFVSIWSPTPETHATSPQQTVARAELAVRSRLRPLVLYDPKRSDAFGPRLDLEGNPAEVVPADGVLAGAPADRIEAARSAATRAWGTLQELAGLESPFAEAARAAAEATLEARHTDELRQVEARHETERAAVAKRTRREQAELLQAHLLALSGWGDDGSARDEEPDA